MSDQYFDALIDRVQSAKAVLLQNCAIPESAGGGGGFGGTAPTVYNADLEEARRFKKAVDEVRSSDRYARSPSEGKHMGINGKILESTLDELNNAIEDGRIAFRNLIILSNATFAIGLLLLLIAAISGLILQNEILAIIFGFFGIFAVVTIFVMKPNVEIQRALSNLMQAQAVFLDYYNQLHFWAPNVEVAGSMEDKRQASQALHDSTTFALKAIQEYVEPVRSDRLR